MTAVFVMLGIFLACVLVMFLGTMIVVAETITRKGAQVNWPTAVVCIGLLCIELGTVSVVTDILMRP